MEILTYIHRLIYNIGAADLAADISILKDKPLSVQQVAPD